MEILKCLQFGSTTLHFVGDLQQAIYDFRHVVPEKVAGFVAANGFLKSAIGCNFRSCQEIVNTCNAIVGNGNATRGMCEARLTTPCLFVTYKDNTISSLPRWFEAFVRQRGLEPDKSAIVARGWSTVSKLRPSGNTDVDKYQTRLAMAIHLWKTRAIQAMDQALKYVGHFIASRYFLKGPGNSREYYCPRCVSSPLYWRLFLADILRCTIENATIVDLDQTWTDWAADVRKGLPSILQGCRHTLAGHTATDSEPLPDFGSCDFRALPGSKNGLVRESLATTSQEESVIRTTTIHSVKGETLDAIMVVSAPSTRGTSDGHWTQWLASPSSEAARFAYVASSRPQYLLVWAIPEQRDNDYGRLRKYGFVPYPEEGT